MENKTCGDCKSFPGYGYYCPVIGRFCDPNNEKPCEFFEKPRGRIVTKGDRIRQMSNDGIAAFVCGVLNDRREAIFRSVLDLLNAPDGKDINVPTKESEGKMREELRECPFCGKSDKVTVYTEAMAHHGELLWIRYGVKCKRCHFGIPTYAKKEAAIHKWNTRPTENALEGLKEVEK